MADLVLTPLGWLFLAVALGGAALLAAVVFRRTALRTAALAVPSLAALVLVLAALPPVAAALHAGVARLGTRWPPLPSWAADGTPDAIVVFSGGLADRNAPGTLGAASFERLVAAVEAARRWPEAAVLFSGGAPGGGAVTAGGLMAEHARRLGLAPERIVLEPAALDTRENALYCARILAARGVRRPALVTSPEHMARARAALRQAGFESLPLPSAPVPGDGSARRGVFPDTTSLVRTSNALHELVGLAVYRLRGWTGDPEISSRAPRS